MVEKLTIIYRVMMLLAGIAAITRFRSADLPVRFICGLIWLGTLTESGAYLSSIMIHSNYLVYNLSFCLEFLFICLYYNFSLTTVGRYHIGYYIAGMGLCLAILNMIFLQPMSSSLTSHFLFLECLVVICFSLFSLSKWLLINDDTIAFPKMAHFWIPCILLMYQSGTFVSWGLYDQLNSRKIHNASILDILILSVNILTYLSYTMLLINLPKMRLRHV